VKYLFSLVLISWMSVWAADIQIPALRSPVMDEANFLSEREEQDLNQLAYEIYTNKGPQITIFTANDMQGYEIEDFSIRVAEKWQLGTKEQGNGLLIIIAKAERKMRIEVGQGIEGEITDYESNRYITQVFAPAFKQGQFHAGLRMVMEDVAGKFNIKMGSGKSYVRRSAKPVQLPKALVTAFPFIIIFIILGQLFLSKKPFARGMFTGTSLAGAGFLFGGAGIALIGMLFFIGLMIGLIGLQNLLFALAAGGGRSRGGFGGGGFGGGGGGWSGGGGGFSGGGSSGSW
jgi:uncharacterized protein